MFIEHLSKAQCTFWSFASQLCRPTLLNVYYFIDFQPLLLGAPLPLGALTTRLARLWVNPALRQTHMMFVLCNPYFQFLCAFCLVYYRVASAENNRCSTRDKSIRSCVKRGSKCTNQNTRRQTNQLDWR